MIQTELTDVQGFRTRWANAALQRKVWSNYFLLPTKLGRKSVSSEGWMGRGTYMAYWHKRQMRPTQLGYAHAGLREALQVETSISPRASRRLIQENAA